MSIRPSAHLFCAVVDNLGDVGIAWMLATGLADDYGFDVTLFIDDPAALEKLAPDYRKAPHITVCPPEAAQTANPGDFVIEILSGTAPEPYMERAAARPRPPVWVIYEYLSAEEWVEDCHLRPSPHPRLSLSKTFFYPGFTEKTGGLLFRTPAAAVEKIPEKSGTEHPLTISLFCYDNENIATLLDFLARGSRPVTLRVPTGPATPHVTHFLGVGTLPTTPVQCGALILCPLPFMPRAAFDTYLAENDVNFVRGEESLTSAVMAGKPLIWNIYPQENALHLEKLAAFFRLYTNGLSPGAAQALMTLSTLWNQKGRAAEIGPAWENYQNHLPELAAHARQFTARMRQNGSALKKLVDFYQKHC